MHEKEETSSFRKKRDVSLFEKGESEKQSRLWSRKKAIVDCRCNEKESIELFHISS